MPTSISTVNSPVVSGETSKGWLLITLIVCRLSYCSDGILSILLWHKKNRIKSINLSQYSLLIILVIFRKSVLANFMLVTLVIFAGMYSDLQGIRTTAKQDGDDWILNGSKTFITNGYLSDVVIVVAITNPQAKSAAHGISLFLVESGTPGYKKGKKLYKIGLKAQVLKLYTFIRITF